MTIVCTKKKKFKYLCDEWKSDHRDCDEDKEHI